jgi:hypothetical protein
MINIYRRHEGQLSASQVRTRTLLSLTRSEILQNLASGADIAWNRATHPEPIDRRFFSHPTR